PDRVGAPQAGRDERSREIERASVIGAAQAIALAPERDVSRLAVVVALRLEGGELVVLPLLLGLVGEAEDGNAEHADQDVNVGADREPVAVADEFDRLGADVVALAHDLEVDAAGRREVRQRHVVAGRRSRPGDQHRQCQSDEHSKIAHDCNISPATLTGDEQTWRCCPFSQMGRRGRCARWWSGCPRASNRAGSAAWRRGEPSIMEWLANPEIWLSLLTLTALAIVLGIDNLVFIAVLVGKLPKAQQQQARNPAII